MNDYRFRTICSEAAVAKMANQLRERGHVVTIEGLIAIHYTIRAETERSARDEANACSQAFELGLRGPELIGIEPAKGE